MNKILITGATGYIGRRLTERLLEKSEYSLRLLVRNINKLSPSVRNQVAVTEGDTFTPASLAEALEGINVAYYLIHSMGAAGDFSRLDRDSAENFRRAAVRAGVRRIIYLGGLGVKETASEHLLSRLETGEILSADPGAIQTVWLRAGVIIGSGSASFEIIRSLVQKLPLMITPRWVITRTQPIAVDDVLQYLAAAADLEYTGNLVVDIGSGEMSFRAMMQRAARVMGLKRLLVPVPVLSPKLSSFWLSLFTPVNRKIAAALVEGLKSETIQQNDNARLYFPAIKPIAYEQAIQRALAELEQDQVVSRWCDSSADKACDVRQLDNTVDAILHDRRWYDFGSLAPEAVFASVVAVGGSQGWFRYHFLWQLRGLIDKLLGGYGISRGRRTVRELRVGDALDFWKVADIRPGKRLLLLAQMKLPGRAWLEFVIQDRQLIQTAHFYPAGVWGYIYWYSVVPLHHLVFSDMVRSIVERAAAASDKSIDRTDSGLDR